MNPIVEYGVFALLTIIGMRVTWSIFFSRKPE